MTGLERGECDETDCILDHCALVTGDEVRIPVGYAVLSNAEREGGQAGHGDVGMAHCATSAPDLLSAPQLGQPLLRLRRHRGVAPPVANELGVSGDSFCLVSQLFV